MAPQAHRDLAAELSALLADIDIAIRARLSESTTRRGRPLVEPAGEDKGLRSTIRAALRRLTRPAGRPPASRRARSGRERARRIR